MKFVKIVGCLFFALLIACAIFWTLKPRKTATEPADEDAPVPVEVAKLEKKNITESEVAYGSVIAQPARVHVQSVVFESQVGHVLVAPGQLVKAGEPLIEIAPSAAARLQLQQAQGAAAAAHRDLTQTQARFAMKLATNQDLGASQKTAADADLQLQNLREIVHGAASRIVAAADGIVAKLDVQAGQIVPAGGAMVETVSEDDVEARLGIDPGDVDILTPGMPVQIQPVNGNAEVSGTVRLSTRRLDTESRLVDVYVSLPPGGGLLLDSYVKATYTRAADNVLVAPAVAVESDEIGYCIYSIENGKAVRHSIEQGLEANGEVEVSGSGLGAGTTIITTGSHEVSDGAAVKLPGAESAE